MTALAIPQLDGKVPEETVTGSTPDISPYSMFDWYELVYYYEPTAGFPFEKKCVGRWLGVAEKLTDAMAFVVIGPTGIPKTRKSVWALSEDDLNNPAVQSEIVALDEGLKRTLVDSPPDGHLPDPPDDIFEGDEDNMLEPMDPDGTRPEADDYTYEGLDEYLQAEVLLPYGGEMVRGKIVRRKRDDGGKEVGVRDPNPILDTREYEVEFPDGSMDFFTANTIAENLFSQVDNEGRSYQVLSEIVGHHKDGRAISKDDGFITSRMSVKKPKQTTVGWSLEVEWKEGTSDMIPLADLKESNPVEVAEYAVANNIAEEPAFAWWVRPVLRRRDRILKKVKSRYWKRTHKYGVEMPKSVKEALEIDERTDTDFWRKSIEKEMKNVMPAFEFRDDDEMPIGYKHIKYHMVFDVKNDLTRKARSSQGISILECGDTR